MCGTTSLLHIYYWTVIATFSAHFLTISDSSLMTMSTQLIVGPFNLSIWSLTMISKAMSGVKRPVRIPWIFFIANWISRRNCFSSHLICKETNYINQIHSWRGGGGSSCNFILIHFHVCILLWQNLCTGIIWVGGKSEGIIYLELTS